MNDNQENKGMSDYDVNQCARYKFDDKRKADRVFVVNAPEIKIIEIPKVIIQEVIREVKMPVIVKEFEKFPNIVKICLIMQSLTLIGLLLINVIKK